MNWLFRPVRNQALTSMTLQQINERVQMIRTIKDDDETAHIEEDQLQEDFIRYVASLGDQSLAEKARAVLETKNIRFSRWHA